MHVNSIHYCGYLNMRSRVIPTLPKRGIVYRKISKISEILINIEIKVIVKTYVLITDILYRITCSHGQPSVNTLRVGRATITT